MLAALHATPAPMHPSPPASGAPRLDALDVLRGFALLGILVVNIQWFASGFWMEGLPDPRHDGLVDRAVLWLVSFAFEGKFYLLFSFGFGYSFTLAMRREDAGSRWPRRQAMLAALGVAHAVLLFFGDVLLVYAVLGAALPSVARWSIRRVVVTAVAVHLSMVLLLLAMAAVTAAMPPDTAGWLEEGAARALKGEALARDGIGGAVAHNAGAWIQNLPLTALIQAPGMFAMLLLGHAAARCSVLERGGPGALLPRGAWAALAAFGLLGQALYASASRGEDPALSTGSIAVMWLTAPALSLCYAALVLHASGGLRHLLASAGRMSLTNYLLQSLALALVFTGWGAGLAGRLPPLAVLALAGAMYAAQLLLSQAWLQRYRSGPLEALVRRVSSAGAGAR